MTSERPQILVLEDDRAMLDLLAEFLRRQGHEARCFRVAMRALENLQGVDLIISDINIPQMTDQDFLREVRLLRPDLPVIVIRAFGVGGTAHQAAQAGASHYLHKPFKLSELSDAVEGALIYQPA